MATRELLSTAQEQGQTEDVDIVGTTSAFKSRFHASPFVYGALAGGLVGLVLSYDYMTGQATDKAENMNYASQVAPIAGLTQIGTCVLGTAATAFVGAACGAIGQVIFSAIISCSYSSPYKAARTSLAGRALIYHSLEEALSQARTPKGKE